MVATRSRPGARRVVTELAYDRTFAGEIVPLRNSNAF